MQVITGAILQTELSIRNYVLLQADSKEGYSATLLFRFTDDKLVILEATHNDRDFFYGTYGYVIRSLWYFKTVRTIFRQYYK